MGIDEGTYSRVAETTDFNVTPVNDVSKDLKETWLHI